MPAACAILSRNVAVKASLRGYLDALIAHSTNQTTRTDKSSSVVCGKLRALLFLQRRVILLHDARGAMRGFRSPEQIFARGTFSTIAFSLVPSTASWLLEPSMLEMMLRLFTMHRRSPSDVGKLTNGQCCCGRSRLYCTHDG